MENKTLEKKLQAPMEYKWRLQSAKYGKATMVAYVDSRQVQDRLDSVFGVLGWKDEYRELSGNLFCGISVKDGSGDWITKWDVGVESNVEKEKGNSSDSFKRAAVKWGIGRFLYSMGVLTLKTVEYKGKERVADDKGNIIWDNNKLNDYCNEVYKSGNLDRTKFVKKQPVEKRTTPVKTQEFKSVDEVCARIAVLNPEEVVKDFIKKGGKATQVSAIIEGIKKKNDLKGAVKYYESIKHLM